MTRCDSSPSGSGNAEHGAARERLRRVMVKFNDDVELPYDGSVDQHLSRMHDGKWRGLLSKYPGIAIRPLNRALSASRLRELAALGERRDKSYRAPNFLTFFVIELPESAAVDGLLRELAAWPLVQTAYLDLPVADPVVNQNDPVLTNTNYTDEAPHGIDAKYAWGFPGGDGAGQILIDLEQGWTLDHDGLIGYGAAVRFGVIIDTSRPHGTSVLGVVCAQYGRRAKRGVVPNLASVNVVSHSGDVEATPEVIGAAIGELSATGGVLLLEAVRDDLPIELSYFDYAKIRLATAIGIVVVAAAGNGSHDLDAATDVVGRLVLRKGHADFRDSRAILVGAATWDHPHERLGFSNFGSRVDCYGWGENVRTPSSTPAAPFSKTLYEEHFGGTSSAAPMIAGAALAVLGLAAAKGTSLNPFQVRAILSDANLSTASVNGSADKIGVMPALRKIIDSPVLSNPPPAMPPND